MARCKSIVPSFEIRSGAGGRSISAGVNSAVGGIWEEKIGGEGIVAEGDVEGMHGETGEGGNAAEGCGGGIARCEE